MVIHGTIAGATTMSYTMTPFTVCHKALAALFGQVQVDPLKDLDPLVKRWLTLPNRPENHLRRESSIRKVDRTPVTVLQSLGVGGEATVYLVQTRFGLAVLKKFHSASKMDSHLQIYRTDLAKGFPEILAADTRNNSVLLQYREGIPIDDLTTYAEELGLEESEVSSIRDRWKKWLDQDPRFSSLIATQAQAWKEENNVVYSPKDETFYYVDPR